MTESREKTQVTGATEKKVLFIFSTTGNFTGSFSMNIIFSEDRPSTLKLISRKKPFLLHGIKQPAIKTTIYIKKGNTIQTTNENSLQQ